MNDEIIVMVRAGSTIDSIEYFGNSRYLIRVKEKEEEMEKLNQKVIGIISKYAGVPTHKIKVISEKGNHIKIFKIV